MSTRGRAHIISEAMEFLFNAVLHFTFRQTSDDNRYAGNVANANNVVVFGSSGTGKTSLVNALAGTRLPIGSGVAGVTFQSTPTYVPHTGVDYVLHDTVGLKEARGGKVSGLEAVSAIVQLLHSLCDGVLLMVMVISKRRMDAAP